jgi:uncharacterized membrane protein YgdD (TMEM256/DUF423 family)
MHRAWITIAGVLGALAALGAAMGEHRLAADPTAAGWARTASEFAFVHALALLGLAALGSGPELVRPWAARLTRMAGLCYALGTLLFSGSLWVLAFAGIRLPGLTPLGGTLLILGWLALAAAGLVRNR